MQTWPSSRRSTNTAMQGAYRHVCGTGRVSVTYTSYTDCLGVAKALFITSSFGGENHILVAVACPGSRTGQSRCVDPDASKTVEVWRRAYIHQVILQDDTGAPLHPCDDEDDCTTFQGSFGNDFSLVDATFGDCFVQVIRDAGDVENMGFQRFISRDPGTPNDRRRHLHAAPCSH